MKIDEITSEIAKSLNKTTANTQEKNIGTVMSAKDEVIELDGLSTVRQMELIVCKRKGIKAVAINLESYIVGAIVLNDFEKIVEGDEFETTGQILSIGVSDDMLGHVVDINGNFLDIDHKPRQSKQMLFEKIAPGVNEREPVGVPLKTGITAIDALTPIGRGQRQLIIGNRSTGKSTIAIDTIINQSNFEDPVISVYCAIGQKNSKIANLKEILTANGAMQNTIIVSAAASDSVSNQYLAPYAATAIAEYFMDKGKDVLVIYDDLTKHAFAYRQISLILRRPPGREAYPGDIFYLHSRLLERSCRLNEANGGGSITSLPIIETQFGDVSAYIPTNVISITDGQVYLDSDLFNSNVKPAFDVGNSVSRVGGAAQNKALKSVSGTLKIELATFKDLEAFAQFGSSELDAATKSKIERGQKLNEILKQKQFSPLSESVQIALIMSVTNGYFDNYDLNNISDVKDDLISYINRQDTIEDYKVLLDSFFENL